MRFVQICALALAAFASVSLPAFAEEASSSDSAVTRVSAIRDPASWLGLTPAEAVSAFGAPSRIGSVRGPDAWQDDVIFFYDGLELFWYKDRVWQIRLESAFGVSKGQSREAVKTSLGEPLNTLEGAFIYQRSGRSFPMRLRVGFDASGSVTDLYLYRADY